MKSSEISILQESAVAEGHKMNTQGPPAIWGTLEASKMAVAGILQLWGGCCVLGSFIQAQRFVVSMLFSWSCLLFSLPYPGPIDHPFLPITLFSYGPKILSISFSVLAIASSFLWRTKTHLPPRSPACLRVRCRSADQ